MMEAKETEKAEKAEATAAAEAAAEATEAAGVTVAGPAVDVGAAAAAAEEPAGAGAAAAAEAGAKKAPTRARRLSVGWGDFAGLLNVGEKAAVPEQVPRRRCHR